MHHNYHYLSPLAVALILGIASPTHAAKPLLLQKASFEQIRQKFLLAKHAVSATKDTLGLVSEHTDPNKVTHVRLQQYHLGVPVHGGYAIMHSSYHAKSLAAAQSRVSMNGIIYEGLYSELGQPNDSFIRNAALALEQFKARYAHKKISEEKITPMVYLDEQHKAHWAYKVSLFIPHQKGIPEQPTAIIDATTYQPFVQWNDIKTQKEEVNGIGFGGNHKMGIYRFGTDLPYLNITRDVSAQTCFMENSAVKVLHMEHKYSSRGKVMKFNCPTNTTNIYLTGYNGDGLDEDNGAASPTNDALYVGYVIHHMYADWYHINALSNSDGSAMQLVMRTHYGEAYENAYWDGKQMTFGCGEDMMYPLVTLGVGAHEISHGFTEQHSNLEYHGQSGGMNESFSDMASQSAEYYSTNKSSWQIGGEIMKEHSGYEALRYMDKPSRDGKSIDSADAYYAGLDVHYSSGVYNRLFYILANQPDWNTRKAFDVMVKANMDYWTPYATFDEGGCGVLHAAMDLGYSPNDVKNSLQAVAIKLDSCKI